jgi:NADH-quinone oxidoreductase subunit M
MPLLSFFFVLLTFSRIGLPGLNGFAGEFLLLTGAFQRGWGGAPQALGSQLLWIAVLSTLGVVLGAWYMLYLVQRVFFGPLKEPMQQDHAHSHGHAQSHGGSHGTAHAQLPPGPVDMKPREVLALAPLVVFIFWIGLYPKFFLDYLAPAVDPLGRDVTQYVYAEYGPPQRLNVSRPDNAVVSASMFQEVPR